MEKRYSASMQYTDETVLTLSKAIYEAFGTKIRLGLVIGGLLLIYFGISTGLNTAFGIIVAALGCWALCAYGYPAVYRAKRVIAAFGGSYPLMTYEFGDGGFTMTVGEQSQEYGYGVVIRLAEKDGYLFLFPDRDTAFMLDPATASPPDSAGLKSFIADKTGLEWTKSRVMLGASLYSIIGSLKNTRKKSGRDK